MELFLNDYIKISVNIRKIIEGGYSRGLKT